MARPVIIKFVTLNLIFCCSARHLIREETRAQSELNNTVQQSVSAQVTATTNRNDECDSLIGRNYFSLLRARRVFARVASWSNTNFVVVE
jgi:shikimate kinase